MRPRSGFRKPSSVLRSVVLPAPLGPRRPVGAGQERARDAGERQQRAVGDGEVLELDERDPAGRGRRLLVRRSAAPGSAEPPRTGFGGGGISALQRRRAAVKFTLWPRSLIDPIARVGFAARGVRLRRGGHPGRAGRRRGGRPDHRCARRGAGDRALRRAAAIAPVVLGVGLAGLRGVAVRAGVARPRRQGQRAQGPRGARGVRRPAASATRPGRSPRAASASPRGRLDPRRGRRARWPSPGPWVVGLAGAGRHRRRACTSSTRRGRPSSRSTCARTG